MIKKPLILITNDDGFEARGLTVLTDILRTIGIVKVVAPEQVMSGMSHAVTSRIPLRLWRVETSDGYEKYVCSGTPVDCVKLGEQFVLGRKPDLMVSGINHGSNASINIVYSGTMSAALESAIGGVPSIGFSLTNYSKDADFDPCKKYVKMIVENVLQNGLSRDVCLNVNIPSIPENELIGIKICRQARSRWIEDYDNRKDPFNRDYFWLSGKFDLLEEDPETDDWALKNNYVSVVPIQVDRTAHHMLDELKKWEDNA